jgi:hypothetical protein
VVCVLAYEIGKRTPGHAEVVKDCCRLTDFTVVGDLARLPHSLGALALHLFRTVVGLAMPLSLVAAGTLVLRRGRVPVGSPSLRALLLVGGLMVAQPLVISSGWNAGAEPRLSALAVVPAIGVAALVADRLEPAIGARELVVLLAIFALASLSHRFASVGPRTAGEFAALEAAAMAGVAVVVGRRLRADRALRE